MSAKSLPDHQTVIRPTHLAMGLSCSEVSLIKHINAGKVPRPDARGPGNQKLWRLSTIRAWNPTVADAIDQLLACPAFAPRPSIIRGNNKAPTPLLAA